MSRISTSVALELMFFRRRPFYLTDAQMFAANKTVILRSGELYPLDDHGTSHMAAMDQSGMAVSLRTTVSPQLFDGVVAEAKF
jgi:gamma-glutamyltranspeptidase